MNTLFLINTCLAGMFGFAAIHHAVQWWFSPRERVFLVFAIQCALYTAFNFTILSRSQETTIAAFQVSFDRALTIALLFMCLLVQFYALLGGRRDIAFRASVVGVFAVLIVLNQVTPLRGTVVGLEPVELPGGGTALHPTRTAPGAALILFYMTTVVVQLYGGFVAHAIWKRGDRVGGSLIALGAAGVAAGSVVAVLVDFAGLRAPFGGALPHALFLVSMTFFLAREYSARAARLVVANRHFEAVFEHAPIGMALLAPDQRILRVNRAICQMFGAPAEALCTQRPMDFTLDDDGGSQSALGRMLAGELQTYVVEKRFRRVVGEPGWALIAVSLVSDDQARPTSIIVQMQDATELRAYRQELEEVVATRTRELRDAKEDAERANAVKSAFIAHMSHEIRTPLGVILLYTQLLQRAGTLDEAQRKKTDIMLSNGKHLRTLLSDVLEMSKIEAGHAELVEGRFDPRATLDEVEHMFAFESASKEIELTLECSAELPSALFGDSGKVKQILINLVSNALKFTQRGSIRIAASARPLAGETTSVKVVVADTGVGVAAADLERMFQPFEQLRAGAKAGGTGLGLTISRAHARLMGGDLEVESRPGAGTTFTFTFVARRVAAEADRAGRETPPRVSWLPESCRVLIVDDLEHNRDILAELLSRPGIETRTAGDGAVALAIHADWSPDLVLMDLRMPEIDGLEAIRRMKTSGSNAAIGVISASDLPEDEREALARGADFFMRKPYDERELFEHISRVLAARERVAIG